MTESKQHLWVGIWKTSKFICMAGYAASPDGMITRDPNFASHLLAPDASDYKLGEVLLKAFGESRMIYDADEAAGIFDSRRASQRYESWVKQLVEKYGYSDRSEFLKHLKCCAAISYEDSSILLVPMAHAGDGVWRAEGPSERDGVTAYGEFSYEELGQAIRKALDQCT